MDGFQIIRWLSSDDTAAVYEAAGPGARPLIYTVGHRPAEPAAEFTAWAERLRSVRHPHLVAVAAAGLTEDQRPYVMCGTGSTTLAERLVRTPPGVNEVVRTTTAIADALDTAHAAGLRHGTVCPSTVVYAADGTPLLTGFDMCAPSLVKTARPGLYTAPEADPGPPADVYALAATAYVALGGTLPYVGDPTDQGLRLRGISELPGVPPELTGMLRTALNPDPASRPSAALLRDALSTVEVMEASTTGALAVAVVGSDVRATSRGVASINQAVTGMQPMIKREKAPPLPPSLGPAPGQPPPPAKPKAAKASRSGRRFAVVVVVLTLVAAGLGAAWLLRDQFAAATDDDRSAPIEQVDFAFVSFTVPADADRKVTLSNGSATSINDSGGAEIWSLVGDPVFADGNHNGDQDTAAIHLTMETPGNKRSYVLVFTWDGALKQAEQVVNGVCEVVSMEGDGPGFTLELVSANPFVPCAGLGGGDKREETITIEMRGGFLVQSAPHDGAVSRCEASIGPDAYSDGDPPVYVAASDSAPELSEDIDTVTVFYPETAEPIAWHLARVTLTDGTTTCGWVDAGDL